MGSQTGAALRKQTLLWFIVGAYLLQQLLLFFILLWDSAQEQCLSVCQRWDADPHYEYAIEEFCLSKFRLDMQELDQGHWCSWEDTVEIYGDLTNCTYLVALKMECFWPNRLVDEFFIRVHKHYFHDCALSGRLPMDPPNRILGTFIVVPILVTLLMTALVVWRSKRSEGIM